jgi:exodeoxyribonuclease III
MTRIISWNVNGIRACCDHGFWDSFSKFNADIVCLQEIKAFAHQIPQDLFSPQGYYLFANSSATPGRSGVAIYSKTAPLAVEKTVGLERFDAEGRYLKLVFPEFTLVNFYLPHGGRFKENLAYKLEVYGHLFKKLPANSILLGDFNIAHKEIDLARPKQNKNNIMFTPEERKQIDRLIASGFVDSFRLFNNEPGNYTWLSYLKNAREKGLGWRIDYAFVAKSLLPKTQGAFILPEVTGSDHCPIGLEMTI